MKSIVKDQRLIFFLRFVKCRDIQFSQPVQREKAPTMAYHYLWGSKALNIANSTIYGQYAYFVGATHFNCMAKLLGYQVISGLVAAKDAFLSLKIVLDKL